MQEYFMLDAMIRPIHFSFDGKDFFIICKRIHSEAAWFTWIYIAESKEVHTITKHILNKLWSLRRRAVFDLIVDEIRKKLGHVQPGKILRVSITLGTTVWLVLD